MRRDTRLLIALLLFLASVVSWVVQAWIVQAYIFAAVMGGWDQFAEFFSVNPPASGPNEFCFDFCAPELPFAAGWIGLCAFLVGWILVAYAWWKPRL